MNKVTHSQTCAILIDGNNIQRGIFQKYGINKFLDYNNFIPFILNNRTLTFFDYFIEGQPTDKESKFADQISKHYFGNVHKCHKSADVPLSIHAVKTSELCSTIIIFSGDADYIELVDYLKSIGRRVEIVCVYGTANKVLLEKAHDWRYIQVRDVYTLGKQKEDVKIEDTIGVVTETMEKVHSDIKIPEFDL